MRRKIFAPAVLLATLCYLLLVSSAASAGTLQALPLIGYAYGVDGNNVVGQSGGHGFLYNGSKYSVIEPPTALEGAANDIQGNRIVGRFSDATGMYGFLFDGSTYTTLNHPLAVKGTIAAGVDGNNIVGWYVDAKNVPHGFLFDGSAYTTIDSPLGAHGTQLWGISGQKIVGTYFGSFSTQGGFVYDGTSFTNLVPPSGTTFAYDVEGNKVVGGQGSAGFIYDGSQYTQPLGGNLPGINDQSFTFTGISGNRLVGNYVDLPPVSLPHPFIYVIPEPTTLLMAASAAVGVALVAACRAKGRRAGERRA